MQLQNIATNAMRLDLTSYDYLELWRTNRAWVVREHGHLPANTRDRIERLSKKHYEDLSPGARRNLDRKLFYLRHLALAGSAFTEKELQNALPGLAARFQAEMMSTAV